MKHLWISVDRRRQIESCQRCYVVRTNYNENAICQQKQEIKMWVDELAREGTTFNAYADFYLNDNREDMRQLESIIAKEGKLSGETDFLAPLMSGCNRRPKRRSQRFEDELHELYRRLDYEETFTEYL